MINSINFQKLPEEKRMIITHHYNASLETLWDAHTQSDIIEKWWAPAPYKAIVISNNFHKGGKLHYYMLAPDGQKHYCLTTFLQIDLLKSYEALDSFCDENGEINAAFPSTRWVNSFEHKNGITFITNTLNFEKLENMNTLCEMGFEQGYTIGLNQLHVLFAK
jgi:uncharacterized protein YndB with AHSA1/START domain